MGVKMITASEIIKGQRITLQKAVKSFLQAQVHNDEMQKSLPELSPWLGWARAEYSIEDSYDYLQGCEGTWKKGTEFNYMILDKDKNFMGMISALNITEKDKSLEIGYWLSTPYTKQGYMQEAVKLMEKEFFGLGINRIVIRTDVLNKKSANVPQKLGYVFEGIQRQSQWSDADEKFRDINVFSKLKSEYEQNL